MTKYTISEERQKEISEQREDENVYQMVARQVDMTTPFEATWLYLSRKDESQRSAWQFHQMAKSARWNRLAVWAAVLGTFINGALLIIFK